MKDNHKEQYQSILDFDEMLEREQPNTKIRSKLYISKSRKRIKDLSNEDFKDKLHITIVTGKNEKLFDYRNKKIWNGF